MCYLTSDIIHRYTTLVESIALLTIMFLFESTNGNKRFVGRYLGFCGSSGSEAFSLKIIYTN